MIIYNDILNQLKEAGYSTSRLRSEKILSESVLSKIRHNESINLSTIDKICQILKCDISDIVTIKKD